MALEIVGEPTSSLESPGAMVVVDGKAVFDPDIEAFQTWAFFLPKGPCEDVENMGTYVQWRSIRNRNFFDATLARLKDLRNTLKIESMTSSGLQPETLLDGKWSCLQAQKFAMGFMQNRQLHKAQTLAQEALDIVEFCTDQHQWSRNKVGGSALVFLRGLCRMSLGVVFVRARRYVEAANLFNQNLTLGQMKESWKEEEGLEVGPKEMVLVGACHAQMYFLNLAIKRPDLAGEHAALAVEVFEQHLGDVPAEDADMHQKVATLAAAYGNAGVLAILQENLDVGVAWLEKAKATLENAKGVKKNSALGDELANQLEYAQDLRRYRGDAAQPEEGRSPTEDTNPVPV